MTELELADTVMRLIQESESVARVCSMKFLRHLEHLVATLEPEKLAASRNGNVVLTGPRYWYCESPTGKQWVFTPEGLIYTCTESVGKPANAAGRFDQSFILEQSESKDWIGRPIL